MTTRTAPWLAGDATPIKRLRKQSGLNQESVAEHLGVSTRTIRALESGAQAPSLRQALDLARLFCVDVSTILPDGVEGVKIEGDVATGLRISDAT